MLLKSVAIGHEPLKQNSTLKSLKDKFYTSWFLTDDAWITFRDVERIYFESQKRMTLWELAQEALRHWISKEYSIEKVRKFIGKINNGFRYWFTFIINPGVEPTNNRAERALRGHMSSWEKYWAPFEMIKEHRFMSESWRHWQHGDKEDWILSKC